MLLLKIPPDPVGPSSGKPLSNCSDFLRDRLECVPLLSSTHEVEIFAHSSKTDYTARQPQ